MRVRLDDLVRSPLLVGEKILVVMVGLSGSGKSTIAEALWQLADYLLVSFDHMMEIIGQNPQLRWGNPSNYYMRTVEAAMQQHSRVVADYVHLHQADRDYLRQLADRHGFRVVMVLMNTDVSVSRSRVWVEPGVEHVIHPLEVFEAMVRAFALPDNVPDAKEGPWLVLEQTEDRAWYKLSHRLPGATEQG